MSKIKTIKMFIIWPIVFMVVYYFFSFEIAAIISLLYLHIIIVLIFRITEKQTEKIVQIITHIKNKDELMDPSIVDFSSIHTAEDVLTSLKKLK